MESGSEERRWGDKKGTLMQKDTMRIFFSFLNPPFHIFFFSFTPIFGYNSNLKFYFLNKLLAELDDSGEKKAGEIIFYGMDKIPSPSYNEQDKFGLTHEHKRSGLDFEHLYMCPKSSPYPSFQ